MFSIEGNLYNTLYVGSQLVILNALFTLACIPILTIPIAFLFLCRCIINIVDEHKMFANLKFSWKIWRQAICAFIVSIASFYSILFLLDGNINFTSVFFAAFLLSYNVIIYYLVLTGRMKIFTVFRVSFFYNIAYFYKTILLVFACMAVGILLWFIFPVLILTCLFAVYLYFFIKYNSKTLEPLLKMDELSKEVKESEDGDYSPA